jgi:predicted transcriptional regulator
MDTSGLNELLATILKSRASDEIPKGWYTSDQLCEKSKVNKTTMGSFLHNALDTGVIERKKFRVIINGRTRHVYFYKEKKQGKA